MALRDHATNTGDDGNATSRETIRERRQSLESAGCPNAVATILAANEPPVDRNQLDELLALAKSAGIEYPAIAEWFRVTDYPELTRPDAEDWNDLPPGVNTKTGQPFARMRDAERHFLAQFTARSTVNDQPTDQPAPVITSVNRREELEDTYHNFCLILENEGVELRRDQRSQQAQFRVQNCEWPQDNDFSRKTNNGEWQFTSDDFVNFLRNEIISRNYQNTSGSDLDFSKDRINDFVEAKALATSVDDLGDYLDYLRTLPKYNPEIDGVPSLNFWRKWMGEGVKHYPETDAWDLYLTWAARIGIWTTVARHYFPGAEQEQWLHIIGDFNAGKSSLLPNCLPEDIRANLCCDNVELGMDRKEIAERAVGKAFVEFPEAAGIRVAENRRVKAMMTARDDQHRPAYGRRNVRFPRQWVGYITSNPSARGNVQERDRRFMVVELQTQTEGETLPLYRNLDAPAPNRTHGETNRDVLWLEALAAYDARQHRKWHCPPVEVVRMVIDLSRDHTSPQKYDWYDHAEDVMRICRKDPGRSFIGYLLATDWALGLTSFRPPQGKDMEIPDVPELVKQAHIADWLNTPKGKDCRAAITEQMERAGFKQRRPRDGDGSQPRRWFPPEITESTPEPSPIMPTLTDDDLDEILTASEPPSNPLASMEELYAGAETKAEPEEPPADQEAIQAVIDRIMRPEPEIQPPPKEPRPDLTEKERAALEEVNRKVRQSESLFAGGGPATHPAGDF